MSFLKMPKKTSTYYGNPCSVCGAKLRYSSSGNCVPCAKKRQAARKEIRRYQYDPAWRRAYQLKVKYGISLEDYDRMVAEQHGACAVCGGPPGGAHGRFHVDHNHSTGEVRGLLCHKCNVGLGSFEDDPARLFAAAQYLARF